MLVPLTDLVGKCGETRSTKKKGTKKKAFYWDKTHQKAFDNVNATVTRDKVLAYPDYDQVFEIFTDASSKQLGTVITQNNRPLHFSAENCLRRSKSIP